MNMVLEEEMKLQSRRFSHFTSSLIPILALVLALSNCSNPPKPSPTNTPSNILPEIAKFVGEHSEFGTALEVETLSDWAQGKRQRVTFDQNGKRRSMLFYTKDQEVETVYEDGPDGRKKIWGEYEQLEAGTPVTKEASESLPAYTVLSSNTKIGGGGKFGDILVPSLSRKTPVETRERVFRAIASKEGLDEVSFYSMEDAYKANTSSSYAASHPKALQKGFLGSLSGGRFTAGETLYP
jgi:hypothetical protein